jgi:hypothetical protein
MTYNHLNDAELHKLVRRRLQERPTDPIAWQALICELRSLDAAIMARIECSGYLMSTKQKEQAQPAAEPRGATVDASKGPRPCHHRSTAEKIAPGAHS